MPLPRGRTRQRGRGSLGFILVDALVALLIAAVALATILGGVATSVRLVAAQRQKLLSLVQQENGGVQQAPEIVDTIR